MVQILFLSSIETIILNIIAWGMFHLSIGYLSAKIPLEWLNPDHWFFQTFVWERHGMIYDQLFHVRAWKRFIPNGSALYRGAFSIKNLPTNDPVYLSRWVTESVRSEVCHWIMIIPGFFFFLWNDVAVGWLMVVYAFLNNLIPVIMQRFNRPRMRKLITQLERKNPQISESYGIYAPQQAFSHYYK